MKTPLKFLLPLLLLSLPGILRAANDGSTFAPSQMALDAAASLQPLPKNGVVKLKVIASDFANNQLGASGKYGGRRITVIGRVAAISQGDENKEMVVTLQDPSASLPAVKAQFLAGSIPENSSIQISPDGSQAFLLRRDRSGNILGKKVLLSVGQKASIKGDFKELKVGDIVLTDCKIESK